MNYSKPVKDMTIYVEVSNAQEYDALIKKTMEASKNLAECIKELNEFKPQASASLR